MCGEGGAMHGEGYMHGEGVACMAKRRVCVTKGT